MHKENKNNNLIQQIFSSASVSVSIHKNTMTHACIFLCLKTSRSACGFYVRTPAPASAAPCFFFALGHKKYSYSFIKLRLNHCCHVDYFNNVLTFLGLEHGSCVAVYAGSEISRISSKISSFELWRWTKVLRVWKDRIKTE